MSAPAGSGGRTAPTGGTPSSGSDGQSILLSHIAQ